MLPEDLTRLRHMLDSAQEAAGLIKGKTREDLDRDRLLNLALVRLLEIVGEAASRVTIPTRIKSLSVNNSNFSPADYGCCQMMQGDIAGIGFLIANQELTKPVEP